MRGRTLLAGTRALAATLNRVLRLEAEERRQGQQRGGLTGENWVRLVESAAGLCYGGPLFRSCPAWRSFLLRLQRRRLPPASCSTS